MIGNKSILAIILARSESKRLPKKNIRNFNGKPLISWTIKSALNSKYIDRLIVSTDSSEIAQISEKYKAEVPFRRPKYLATDHASSESAILHSIRWLRNKEHKKYFYTMLLQPTSPLRSTFQIDDAIEKISSNSEAYSLISASRPHSSLFVVKPFKKSKTLHTFVSQNITNIKSNTKLLYYIPNGAMYIAKTNKFVYYKSFCTPKTLFYLMNSYDSIDIDEETDFLLAEYFLNRNEK
ncbi:MAG: acylneuraminate cytidylyltransferase family protein [Bacteroidota bacterium]